ncbi:MAG: SDR family oxidoreductase [Dehalococcoidales bacterium]|nr:SDR family oxidoreductase [Dehalococcoidales bacterium]
MLLPDKVAIINGGATGMGRATAIKFAEEGCSSVIADVNEAEGKKTAEEASKKGKECIFVKCDITDIKQIKNCADQTIKKFGKVDILVGCAGGVPKSRLANSSQKFERPKRGIANLGEGFWDAMLTLNLKGHAFFCKEVAPYMIKQKFGKIILISSLGVYSPPMPSSEYHSAKAGIIGLVLNLAFELAPHNINVNAILPGPIKTPFYDPLMASMSEKEKEAKFAEMGKSVPLQRIGTAEDIANTVLFFSSEMSSYITGESLIVGGGKPLPVYREML